MIMEKINSTPKYKILTYLFMTYLFSWIAWGILYASDRKIISHNIYDNYLVLFIVIGGSMPSIMSILFTGFFYGSNGIKELLKRFTIWKANPLFYVFVLFYTVSSFFVPLWICNITGSTYKFHISMNFYNILLNFLIIILFSGPLGEELGWRGYVLPKLQNTLNPIYSSVFLGLLWSLWHLPLFFIHGTAQYGFPFSIFVIEDICLSILFTWVYNRTHGSLLFSTLFHASFNLTGSLLYYNPSSYFVKSWNRYTSIAIVLQLIVLLFIILDMIRKPMKESTIVKNHTKILPSSENR